MLRSRGRYLDGGDAGCWQEPRAPLLRTCQNKNKLLSSQAPSAASRADVKSGGLAGWQATARASRPFPWPPTSPWPCASHSCRFSAFRFIASSRLLRSFSSSSSSMFSILAILASTSSSICFATCSTACSMTDSISTDQSCKKSFQKCELRSHARAGGKDGPTPNLIIWSGPPTERC